MPIPKYDQIQYPALNLLKERGALKLREFYAPLAVHFQLTEEERNVPYTSGNGLVFDDRVSWALSYLNMAGLVDKPKRGIYAINADGLKALLTPKSFSEQVSARIAARESPKKQDADTTEQKLALDANSTQHTPQEELYSSFENIRKTVYKDILNTILAKSPTAFERLVVQLLQRMGYGGEVQGSGFVTSATNDGGIDGIIKEDVLGLGRIHIQAKRYDLGNAVGRPEIQGFVGALAGAQSNKGIFITTSYYSDSARKYAASLNTTTSLVLIDGKELAEYIYQYGLGMQVEQTIEIKRLDVEFWDEMPDV